MKLPFNNRARFAAPMVWLLATLSALSSCVRDGDMITPCTPAGSGEKSVMLLISVPNGSSTSSRAIGATEENTIKTIDVLAFKIDGTNETFDYSVTALPASGSTAGSAQQTFTASLRIESNQQRFVLITNAHDQVANMLSGNWQGKPKADMLATLKYNLSSGDRWDATSTSQYTALPMWGESAPETITLATTKLSAIVPLLRMVARMDVQVDSSVSGLRDKFKLKSVDLYNTNTGGNVVPAAGNYSDDSSSGKRVVKAIKPTIPSELQPKSARKVGPIHYTDFTSPGTVDAAMIGAIYTFETNNAAVGTDSTNPDATCLVIGGVYGTDTQPTYYRVDIIDNGTPKKRIDVLRNWRYLINIVRVGGSGKPSVDEAYKSKSINMDATVLAWNDSNMTNIVYNGENFLSTDKTSLSLYKNEYKAASSAGENVLSVQTDYPSGWTVDKIVDAADGTTPVTWLLALNPNNGPANSKTTTYISAQANTTGADRSALVILKAGDKLSTTIKVTQSGAQASPVTLIPKDATSKEINSMVFSAPAGTQPAAQTLTINWTPIDQPVTITGAMTSGATSDFPAGSGQPANTETIPAGTGTKTYTIQPPAITAAEYAANQFLEKSTTYTFKVTDGLTTVNKTVVISQAVYSVQPNSAQYYVVNGSNYSFNVKSNAKWVIKSIVGKTDPSYAEYAKMSLLANKSTDNMNVNTTGGPNSTSGDDVKFTTTSQIGMWGTVDVTFASPDTPSKFPDKTITLIMAAPSITITGIGAAAGGEGGSKYQAASNTLRVPGDPADMYTNANNFGTTMASTVKCETLKVLPGINKNGTDGSNQVITVDDLTSLIANNPDVIAICGNATLSDEVCLKLKREWLDNGKTVFIGIQEQESLMRMLRACFGADWMNNNGIGWDTGSGKYQDVAPSTFQIFNVSHPTTIGPFGDLRGKNWGTQWSGAYGVYVLPDDVIVRYSSTQNTTGPVSPGLQGDPNQQYTAFFVKPFHLMWICDDGFFRNDTPSGTDVSPFYIDPTTKRPATKQYGRDSKVPIYNSALFANLLAWVVARYPNK